MTSLKDAATGFLAARRIAVTGVSRKAQGHGANVVYTRLRERGYEVFAINPNAEQVEGDVCYRDLHAVPGGVDAVVIATNAAAAEATVKECIDLGIGQVWMHRMFGPGSVSDSAVQLGREHGMTVIAGGCPLMFDPASDGGHKMLRRFATLTGKAPRSV